MGQARHGPAQGAARLVVVEGRFMGGHGVHNSIVLEVGHWLQKQLILAANQFIIVDAGLLRHQLDRILRTKIFLDGLNICLGTAAADNAGHSLCRRIIIVIPCGGGNARPSAVLDFADLSKMNFNRRIFVCQVEGSRNRLAGFCVHNGNPYAIHAGVP